MTKLAERAWPALRGGQFFLLLVFYTYMSLTGDPGPVAVQYNDKLMHFAGYLVAGLSATLALPGRAAWQRALLLLLYSTAMEVAQHHMPPRTFSLGDIAANLAGLLAGLGLAELARLMAPEWSRHLLGPGHRDRPASPRKR